MNQNLHLPSMFTSKCYDVGGYTYFNVQNEFYYGEEKWKVSFLKSYFSFYIYCISEYHFWSFRKGLKNLGITTNSTTLSNKCTFYWILRALVPRRHKPDFIITSRSLFLSSSFFQLWGDKKSFYPFTERIRDTDIQTQFDTY